LHCIIIIIIVITRRFRNGIVVATVVSLNRCDRPAADPVSLDRCDVPQVSAAQQSRESEIDTRRTSTRLGLHPKRRPRKHQNERRAQKSNENTPAFECVIHPFNQSIMKYYCPKLPPRVDTIVRRLARPQGFFTNL
jgi:hypothetical protein